jgi:hypothetical protein
MSLVSPIYGKKFRNQPHKYQIGKGSEYWTKYYKKKREEKAAKKATKAKSAAKLSEEEQYRRGQVKLLPYNPVREKQKLLEREQITRSHPPAERDNIRTCVGVPTAQAWHKNP